MRQVERDASLAPVRNLVEWIRPLICEVQHVLQAALRVTRRRFHLDDVGTEIREYSTGGRHERPARNLEDTHALQWPRHRTPFVERLLAAGRRQRNGRLGEIVKSRSDPGGGPSALGQRRERPLPGTNAR